MVPMKGDKILIVGAGCFGVSTAYHLLQRGYTDVTIIDRSPTLPAPDAASNDLNRVIRSSYADKFYAHLAREAILSWKDEKKWGDTYRESGVVVLGSSKTGNETYTDEAYTNDIELGAIVEPLNSGESIRSVFPAGVHTAPFKHCMGYLNREGGWANAGQGLSMLIREVVALGGKLLPGKNVKRLLRQDGQVTGVQCADGSRVCASMLVIATGSWTPSAFPELDLDRICLATGQCIAMIQLSEKDADIYRNCPVVLDFNTGFYVFPPNDKGIVKVAMHSAGYTHVDEVNGRSTPRTVTSDPVRGLHIPKSALQDLRDQLKNVYPDLAKKLFTSTRLCWYNDSPDEDWVISKHPTTSPVIVATAGSGHAYKFLPVIGRLVADLMEDKMDAQLVAKFAIDREIIKKDGSRSSRPMPLDLNELCTDEDWALGCVQ